MFVPFRFVKRLVHFYRPSSGVFSQLTQTENHIRKYSAVGLRFISWLVVSGLDEVGCSCPSIFLPSSLDLNRVL